MTTLYDATRPVKTAGPARRFGAGLVAWTPSYRASHTAADEAWLVEDTARREAEDRRYDRLAAESAATDALVRGLIPADVAELIARTSIVGHPA